MVTASMAALIATSVALAQSDFSAERIKAHVMFLADDLLTGEAPHSIH